MGNDRLLVETADSGGTKLFDNRAGMLVRRVGVENAASVRRGDVINCKVGP